jgi:3-oxocholest-4-en-26-oate---CoA ligase
MAASQVPCGAMSRGPSGLARSVESGNMEFNVADLWEMVVDTIPDHEALVCGDRRLTYAETDERANRLAHALAERGIGAGDHIGLFLYNGTEYLEAMLAAFKIRAVPINVNFRYGEEELRYLLDDADTKAIIFHRSLESKIAAVASQVPELSTFLVVEDAPSADDGESVDADEYEKALAGASAERDFAPRSADDLYVLYTGGTTGMPKGVMWRQEDIFFAALGTGGANKITTPEEIAGLVREGTGRCLPASPFMHGTAHWVAFMTFFDGGAVVIYPDRQFDPIRLWELVAAEGVKLLVIVGDAMARPLVEAIDSLDPAVDLSGLRFILSGGAVLSPAVKLALMEKLPKMRLLDGFGSSETGGQGQMVVKKDDAASSNPRFEVNDDTMVVTDELEPAAVGEVGKLARRGRVPLGYYKDPEKSAATFPVIDGVRWAVPGDHARLEDDGTITVLGRGSGSINTGGEKVYPEEVEAVLKSHVDVFDAVVVGVPDDRWGQKVVAVVQLREGAALDAPSIQAHVKARLSGYKAPREVIAVDAIVRSPSGKPDYRWAAATALRGLDLG